MKSCNLCSNKFSSALSLKIHVRKYHEQKKENYKRDASVAEFCGKECENKYEGDLEKIREENEILYQIMAIMSKNI